MSPSNAELRRFISSAFSEDDFNVFCFDHFPEVRQNFGTGMSMRMKVIILIDDCQRNARISELLTHLKAERPGRFPKSLELDSQEILPFATQQGSIQNHDSVEQAREMQRRLRHFLTRGNCEGAAGIYEVLQKQRLLEQLDPLEASWLQALIMIASHGFDSTVGTEDSYLSALHIQDFWPDALAGAILCQADQIGQSSDREVWGLLRGLPHRIQSVDLRNHFLAFIRKWVVTPDDCAPDIRVRKNSVSKAFLTLFPETIVEAIHRTNPFGVERAEEEEETLYLKGGFWPMHLAYRAVVESTRPLVIFGASGSGLTALAKGLQFHESRLCKEFWIYHQPKGSQDFQVESICKLLASNLLDYMCRKHSRWEYMADNQLSYNINWLGQILSGETVKQHLNGSLLSDKSHTARAERLLARIEPMLEREGGRNGEVKDCKALLAIAKYVFRALGFESIQLLLDMGVGDLDQVAPAFSWVQGDEPILEYVQFTLFIAQSDASELQKRISGIGFFELGWSPNELRALTEHRFLQICDQRNVRSVFESGIDEFFGVMPSTPRQLIRLWNQLIPLIGAGELITADVVKRATTSLEN